MIPFGEELDGFPALEIPGKGGGLQLNPPFSRDHNAAAVIRAQPLQTFQRCGLSSAVRTEKAVDLAAVTFHVDTVKYLLFAKGLVKPLYL